MNRIALSLLTSVAVSLVAGVAAEAATITGVQGEVLVNQGSGYVPVQEGQALAAGDFVVANPGGSAQIAFDSACIITVGSGEVVAITDPAPCTGSVDPAQSSTPGAGPGTETIVIGAVVIGGAIAAVASAGGGDDSKKKKKPADDGGDGSGTGGDGGASP